MTTSRRSYLLTPNRYDALLAAAVLLLAGMLVACFWYGGMSGDAKSVVVIEDGVVRERFPLSDTRRDYQSNGYTLCLVATSKGVRVEYSDCPTQDCVRAGTISRAGESIVCLPARVTVTLEGVAVFDAVAG